MIDLEARSSDELVDELKRRYPNGALVVLSDDDPDSDSDWRLHWSGSFKQCLLLAHYCEWDLMRQYENSQEIETEDNEEEMEDGECAR